VTKRPFNKSKTNFSVLLVVQCYIPRKKICLPIFYALLQNQLRKKDAEPVNQFAIQQSAPVQPAITTETYLKALQRFKSDFCEDPQSPLFKSNLYKLISPLDSKLIIAIKQVFNIQPVTCHFLYVRKLWQMAH
jgi:hypothetical protein